MNQNNNQINIKMRLVIKIENNNQYQNINKLILIMIRIVNNIFLKSIFNTNRLTIPLNTINLSNAPLYKFSTITDKLQKRQNQKSQQEIRKEIQHLANKPSFTLMDYKQRILDQLNKLKSSLRAKMSSQTQQQQKQLQVQRKVLSCLYEDQLNEQYQLRHSHRKAISLVSQVDYNKVTQIFKKAQRYKRMHSMLRGMKQRGQQLPRDMQQLNYLYVKSGLEFQGPKQKYLQYQKRSRIQRGRYIKWRA